MSDQHQEAYTKGKKQLVTSREYGYKSRAGGLGYCGPKRQVHHIIPCVSATSSKDDFIADQDEPGPARRALERITAYDVNQRPNLIGLPNKDVYARKFCKRFAIMPKISKMIDAVKNPLIAACDWPVHLWNHPQYNFKAYQKMEPVWKRANIEIEQHKPVSAQNLKQSIQNCSNGLKRTYLTNAARRKRRTQEAWQDGDKDAFNIC